jgi:uncharacterized protein with von Willebrand factor type A (vWA) domain
MTNEQEMASIGKLVVERKEAERRETAIEREIDRAADHLETTRKLLKLAMRDPTGEGLANPVLDSSIEDLPTSESLRNLVADLRAQREILADLRSKAAKIGI